MLIDSHCHLDFPELASDEGGVLSRARTAGVGWTEIQFTWSTLQSSPGTADFRPFDQLVTSATGNNMRIIGRLGFSTSWNTTAPATVTNAAQREKYPPTSYELWGQYVFTIVQSASKTSTGVTMPEEILATAQVVRVTPQAATAVITGTRKGGISAGMPARLSARMPTS